MAINYGLNRVRFVSPVPSGARVRGRFTVVHVEEFTGGFQVTWGVVIEREGGDKPCCVADWIVGSYLFVVSGFRQTSRLSKKSA